MPSFKGVYRRGKKFYGAKWHEGKTHATRLYAKAEDAAAALEVLIGNLKKGLQTDKKNVRDCLKTPLSHEANLLPIRMIVYSPQ